MCFSHGDLHHCSCEIGKTQEVGGDNLTAFTVWKTNSLKEEVREKQQSEKEDRKEILHALMERAVMEG